MIFLRTLLFTRRRIEIHSHDALKTTGVGTVSTYYCLGVIMRVRPIPVEPAKNVTVSATKKKRLASLKTLYASMK